MQAAKGNLMWMVIFPMSRGLWVTSRREKLRTSYSVKKQSNFAVEVSWLFRICNLILQKHLLSLPTIEFIH